MLGRTLGGCCGLSLTLWKDSVSECLNWTLSALQGARCFLMCHLLNCWETSHNTASLQFRAKHCRFSGIKHLKKLLSCSPCPIFQRGALQSLSIGLQMRWWSQPRSAPILCVAGADRDAPSGWLTSFQVSLSFPITEEHRHVYSGWKCSQRALEYFHPWILALSLSPAWLLLVLMLLRILNALCTGVLCDLSLGGHSLFHLIIFYW